MPRITTASYSAHIVFPNIRRPKKYINFEEKRKRSQEENKREEEKNAARRYMKQKKEKYKKQINNLKENRINFVLIVR